MSQRIRKMDSMKKMEEDYSVSLAASVQGLRNIAIRELLNSIASDSKKHAGFYAAISVLLKKESPLISEEEYEDLEDVIEKHIETESKMVQEVRQLLKAEKDSRVKQLLQEIYADEARHHALMKNLLDAVIKRETLFDEEVWAMLWKDVPTHGAPPEQPDSP
jgi:rubrerythrin